MTELHVFENADALADAAASNIAGSLSEALAARDRASFAAAGGRTPADVYDRLSQAPVDWSRVDITLTDERRVPRDHPDSNAGLLDRRLFKGGGAAAAFIAPDDTAALERLRPLDVVLLGMGEDGHFASLFPGSPALQRGLALSGEESCIDIPAATDGAPTQPRVSLTLPMLTSARHLLLAITGHAKRAVLQRAETAQPMQLPIAAVLRSGAPLTVFWAA